MKLFVTLTFAFLQSLPAFAAPQSVAEVDLSRYAGDWFQISHVPLSFEFGGKPCPCARQRISSGPTQVLAENSCNLNAVDGTLVDLKGNVSQPDRANPAQLQVTFNIGGKPVTGPYWIVGLDRDYRYSVVSNPAGTSLYILSRTPQLSSELYGEALSLALSQGIDTRNLQPTVQQGCRYPN